MSAVAKLLDRRDRLQRGLKALGAIGQLGYGLLEKSLATRLDRAPDYIGRGYGVDLLELTRNFWQLNGNFGRLTGN